MSVGEKSKNNPIIQGIKDPEATSIPLLVQQRESIDSVPVLKREDFTKLDPENPRKNGFSLKTVQSIKRPVFQACIDRKDLRKLLNTMDP